MVLRAATEISAGITEEAAWLQVPVSWTLPILTTAVLTCLLASTARQWRAPTPTCQSACLHLSHSDVVFAARPQKQRRGLETKYVQQTPHPVTHLQPKGEAPKNRVSNRGSLGYDSFWQAFPSHAAFWWGHHGLASALIGLPSSLGSNLPSASHCPHWKGSWE